MRTHWLCGRIILLTVVVVGTIIFQHSWILSFRTVSTSNENDIGDFRTQWCRLQRWRVDWAGMMRSCKDRMPWKLRQANSLLRTDSRQSFIKRWQLQPAGHFSRFFIQSLTSCGEAKAIGGDSWRVNIKMGPSSLAPVVFDLNNGMYEVLFLVLEPGLYTAQVWLDHTLCDGYRDPPADWFIKGTTHGKYQKDGILGYIGDDYINEPLAGKVNVTFQVPSGKKDIYKTGLYKYCTGSEENCSLHALTQSCGTECLMMWDGYGRWVGNSWKPYSYDSLINTRTPKESDINGSMWALGDSVTQRFLSSIRGTALCKKLFLQCHGSYNWFYELKNIEEAKSKYDNLDYNETVILNQIQRIASRPDMNKPQSLFLFNLGIHYSITLNFTMYKRLITNVIRLFREKRPDDKGITVSRYEVNTMWKSSTAIEKEKAVKLFNLKNNTAWRFHTNQRMMLFHTYAMDSMCKAGIKVLDLYPISAAYPGGTLDHVHYPNHVFKPAENLLQKYFST